MPPGNFSRAQPPKPLGNFYLLTPPPHPLGISIDHPRGVWIFSGTTQIMLREEVVQCLLSYSCTLLIRKIDSYAHIID